MRMQEPESAKPRIKNEWLGVNGFVKGHDFSRAAKSGGET
jgi:hypothetical protein